MRYFIRPKAYQEMRVLTLMPQGICEEGESAQELTLPPTAKVIRLSTLDEIATFTDKYGYVVSKESVYGLDARHIDWEALRGNEIDAVLWKEVLRARWRYAWLQFNTDNVHGVWLNHAVGEISYIPFEELPEYDPLGDLVDNADPFRPVPLIENLGKKIGPNKQSYGDAHSHFKKLVESMQINEEAARAIANRAMRDALVNGNIDADAAAGVEWQWQNDHDQYIIAGDAVRNGDVVMLRNQDGQDVVLRAAAGPAIDGGQFHVGMDAAEDDEDEPEEFDDDFGPDDDDDAF